MKWQPKPLMNELLFNLLIQLKLTDVDKSKCAASVDHHRWAMTSRFDDGSNVLHSCSVAYRPGDNLPEVTTVARLSLPEMRWQKKNKRRDGNSQNNNAAVKIDSFLSFIICKTIFKFQICKWVRGFKGHFYRFITPEIIKLKFSKNISMVDN